MEEIPTCVMQQFHYEKETGRKQALSEERERRRAELADSPAEAEVRRHAEELQRGAGTANAEEDNFF